MNNDITEKEKKHVYLKSQLKQADMITTKREKRKEKKRDENVHKAQMNDSKMGYETNVRLQLRQVTTAVKMRPGENAIVLLIK